jgi:hypothetical protein
MRIFLIATILSGFAHVSVLEAQQRSPNSELLGRARAAFYRTDYSTADSVASIVLGLDSLATRRERVEAMQIDAAALYSEDARWQHPDSAVVILKRLVRTEPDRNIPGDLSWPGLDSLLEVVRRSTFGAIARPARDNTITGATSSVTVPVVATRPASFRLVAIAESAGTVIPLDSGGPLRNGVLHFGTIDNDRLRLPSGKYVLRLTAVDSAAPDTIINEYATRVEAPTLQLVLVPQALDSSRLLPERARPARRRNVIIGLGLGGVTALLAALLRGDHPVRDSTSAGASAYVAAAGLTVGAIFFGSHDRGATIARNIYANARLRASFTQAARDARAENERRRGSFRASITIDPEPR